jgi:ribonuclease Z
MTFQMRILAVLAVVLSAISPGFAQPAPNDGFRVTLLGTGTPGPDIAHFGPATLVQAGDQMLLFDAGRGTAIRMTQIGAGLGKIDALFVTHLHSDHVVGIPDVWLTGWLSAAFGARRQPFTVRGPAGTKDLMANLERAYAWDINARAEEQKMSKAGVSLDAMDIAPGAIAYEKNGVKVTAIEVDHGEVLKPAYGYRIEFAGRSAVISGDTRLSPNLARAARGADLIIHEVAWQRPEALAQSPYLKAALDNHTYPAEAGRLFAEVKPKLAAYTHILMPIFPNTPRPTNDDLIRETRQTYDGPLVVGADLMAFEITASGVTVREPPK